MKTKRNRIALALLIAVLILPLHCYAGMLPEFNRLMPEKITDGYLLKIRDEQAARGVRVLWESGHCYIPAETLEQITCYVHEETGPDSGRFIRRTQYLDGGEARHYYIEYKGKNRQTEFHTGVQIRFFGLDGVIERDGIRYLPIDQLLPFLHVQWKMDGDTLCITNDPYSLYDVLDAADDLVFRMDEIVEGGFFRARTAQIANFIIDALENFRIEYFIPAYDEVNGITGSQGIHDNIETAVRGYLADDSSYIREDGSLLTAGNGYLFGQPGGSQTSESLQELKKTSSAIKKGLKAMKMEDLGKQLDKLHLDEALTIAKAQEFCTSMLTDHYRMLDAMFNASGKHTGPVSDGYFADVARYVFDAYGSTWSAIISDTVKKQTTDALIRTVRNGLTTSLLTTAEQTIASLISKTVNLFTNADKWSKSMVKSYYHDAFAALAEERIEALMRLDMGHETLEDIRLCALMMLTASRQGFSELADFYENQGNDCSDAAEVFRSQAEKIRKYQQILYLCYDSVDRDSPNLCDQSAGELAAAMQGVHDRGQLYDFDPYAIEGMAFTVEFRQEKNGVTDRCLRLDGESEYQEYHIRLPWLITGNPEQDAWLWQEVAGQIYANRDPRERLAEDDSNYEYFKDMISTFYTASLALPGVALVKYEYENTPAGGPGRYYEGRGMRLLNLETHEDMEPFQLFRVSRNDYRKGIIRAIIYSNDYQTYYRDAIENGRTLASTPESLVLHEITDEGMVFTEGHPIGVSNYVSSIKVPWSLIPFSLSSDDMLESGVAEGEPEEKHAPAEVLSAFAVTASCGAEVYDYPYDDVLLPTARLEGDRMVYIDSYYDDYEPGWCRVQAGENIYGFVRQEKIIRIAADDLHDRIADLIEKGGRPEDVLAFGGMTLEDVGLEKEESAFVLMDLITDEMRTVTIHEYGIGKDSVLLLEPDGIEYELVEESTYFDIYDIRHVIATVTMHDESIVARIQFDLVCDNKPGKWQLTSWHMIPENSEYELLQGLNPVYVREELEKKLHAKLELINNVLAENPEDRSVTKQYLWFAVSGREDIHTIAVRFDLVKYFDRQVISWYSNENESMEYMINGYEVLD